MTYDEAVRYVESRAILGVRFGLERMLRVLATLGDPQRRAPAVHVVGTNGKTSTTLLAGAALASQGVRVGTYISPHVVDWTERIAIDGAPIRPAPFASAVRAVADAAAQVEQGPDDAITQFEVLTAAALVAFAAAEVDALVVEAGLGGRYDATNVFGGAAVVALTNVALEHTELLGNDERSIAGEKLAVAPDGFDRLVVGALSPAASTAVAAICRDRRLTGWFLGRDVHVDVDGDAIDVRTPIGRYPRLRLALRGPVQRQNLAVALAAAERLGGRSLAAAPLRPALAAVQVPGRFEYVDGAPAMLLDGAHNPAGIAALAAALPQIAGGRRVVAVISVLADKDLAAMLGALAGPVDAIVATRSSHPRARAGVDIAAAAAAAGIRAEVEPNSRQALARARALAGPDGMVVVCGSLYLLENIRNTTLGFAAGTPGMLAPETRWKT